VAGGAFPVPEKGGRISVTQEEKRAWAANQLRARHAQLGTLPRKEDFDEVTRSRIKAFLGPWPRALEAAGLKEPPPAQKPKRRAARKNTNPKEK